MDRDDNQQICLRQNHLFSSCGSVVCEKALDKVKCERLLENENGKPVCSEILSPGGPGKVGVPKDRNQTQPVEQLQELVSSLRSEIAAAEQLRSMVTSVPPDNNNNALSNIRATLNNRQLWATFYQYGNEMILTRSGRRMFPAVEVCFSGMKENVLYTVMLDMVQVSDHRYRFNFNTDKWQKSGVALNYAHHPVYVHPLSPATGTNWMSQPVSFKKLKLTNQPRTNSFEEVQMTLHSMHKYMPQLCVVETNGGSDVCKSFVFEEAEFYGVTSYQNRVITHLKIHANPFARGFRDVDKRKQRKSSNPEAEGTECDKSPPHSSIAPSRQQSKNQRISQHAIRSQEIIQKLANEPPKKVPRQDDAKFAESRGFIDLASTLKMIGKSTPGKNLCDKPQLSSVAPSQIESMTDRDMLSADVFANLQTIVGALSRASFLKPMRSSGSNVDAFQKVTCEAGTQTCDIDFEDDLDTNPVCSLSNRAVHSSRQDITPASPREQEIFLESVNLLRKSCDTSENKPYGQESLITVNLESNVINNNFNQKSNKDGFEDWIKCNNTCSRNERKASVSEKSIQRKDNILSWHSINQQNPQAKTTTQLSLSTSANLPDKSSKFDDGLHLMSRQSFITKSPLDVRIPVTQSYRQEDPVQDNNSPTKEAAFTMVTLASCPVTVYGSSALSYPTILNALCDSNNNTNEEKDEGFDKLTPQVPTTNGLDCNNEEKSNHIADRASNTRNTETELIKVWSDTNEGSNKDDLLTRSAQGGISCNIDLSQIAKKSTIAPEGTSSKDKNSPVDVSPIILNTFSLQPGQKVKEVIDKDALFQNSKELVNGSSNGNRFTYNGVLWKSNFNSNHGFNTENKVQPFVSERIEKGEEFLSSTSDLEASSSSNASESHNDNGMGASSIHLETSRTKILQSDKLEANSFKTPHCGNINVVPRVTELGHVHERDGSIISQEQNDSPSTHSVYSKSIVDPVCSVSAFNAKMATV